MMRNLSICLLFFVLNLASAGGQRLKGVRNGISRRLENEVETATETETVPEKKDIDEPKCKKAVKKVDAMENEGNRRKRRRRGMKEAEATETTETKDKKEKGKTATKEAVMELPECEEEEDSEEAEKVKEATMNSSSDQGVQAESSESYENIVLDCDAIASNSGPTVTPSISFVVSMDVLKESGVSMSGTYNGIYDELQSYVAPIVAGCDESDERRLEDSSTRIVNVDFGDLKFNTKGCSSNLAVLAASEGSACLSTDVPVDIYYVGDEEADEFASKVKSGIEDHDWGVEGVKQIADIEVLKTEEPNSAGAPFGAFIGVAAVLLLCCFGGAMMMKNMDDGELAKGEYEDTDEDSVTKEERHKAEVLGEEYPEATARIVEEE